MIIFYHGSDAYRLRAAVSDLFGRLHAKDDTVSMSAVVDMSQTEDRIELERTLKYPSIFLHTSFIVVRNILADAETAGLFQNILESYAVTKMADIVLVACQEGIRTRESGAVKTLTAYLEKHAAQSVQFQALRGAELTRWANDFCVTRDCSIRPEALTRLTDQTTGDSWALARELDKLCAYAGSDPITSDMLDVLTPARQERDEFELSNALSSKDKRGALAALWRRLQEGVSEQLLIGTLASSLRTLMTVKDLASRGLATPAIAKTAGLHPYVVSKTIRAATVYEAQGLIRAHTSVALLDRRSKNGLVDAVDGLFSVILDL